jgi:6-phosphogluconolactonase (cycloisomerase 2 family)
VEYRINPRTGELSPEPIARVTTGNGANWIAVAPNGESAYVTSENNGKVAQYTINPATGKITPMSPPVVRTASCSLGLAITPER